MDLVHYTHLIQHTYGAAAEQEGPHLYSEHDNPLKKHF